MISQSNAAGRFFDDTNEIDSPHCVVIETIRTLGNRARAGGTSCTVGAPAREQKGTNLDSFVTPLARASRKTDRIHDPRLVFAILAVLAVLGGVAAARILTLLDLYSHHEHLLRVFFIALFFSTILTGLTTLILRWLDRRDPLPWQLYASLLAWGAILSTGLALPANQRILRDVDRWVEKNDLIPYAGENRGFLLGAPIAGPLVEETLKGVGLLLVFFLFRSFFRSPRDGFIMGALVGAGFNWFESALYVANDYAEWGVHTYGTELGGRYGLFGFAGHALFTGLTGLGLGYAAVSKTRVRAVAWALLGYFLAVTAHLVNNGLGVAVVVILHTMGKPIPDLSAPTEENPFLSSWMSASLRSFFTFLPSVLLILYTLVRTGRWEEKTIQTELAGEPDTVISEKERARLARETHWRMRRYPWESRRHSRSIVAEQNRLAFLKYQVEQEGGDVQTDPEIVAQRARIERIRASS